MKKLTLLLSLLIAVLLLVGCGAAPDAGHMAAPEEDVETVVVTDIKGFLNALAAERCVVIDAEELRLDEAADYGFGYSTGAYTWVPLGGGEYALEIRGVDGLTIKAAREGGCLLSTDDATASVLTLRGCRDVTLEGLTLGHRGEPAFCCGDVLYCDGCEGVAVRRCELFGCGVTAVNAWECTRLMLEGCTLRDCSAAAVNAMLCTDVQLRDCEILRCGRNGDIAALYASGCNGFAVINSSVRDGENSFLLETMNSSSVWLLGCEATGNRFSEALFRIYGGGVGVSGCTLAENEFSSCYASGSAFAVTESGKALASFSDFSGMERRLFTGEYIGPAPYVTPSDVYVNDYDGGYVTPGSAVPFPEHVPTEWTDAPREVHVTTVDELLAAAQPHTTVYLDGEEFDLSTASGYGGSGGDYYVWSETFDGPELIFVNLEDFSLVGGGMGTTLVSTQPRYADVLGFDNCYAIRLSDMTVGHSEEPGYCSGGVLDFINCGDVTIERCGLFGCGTVGITATSSYDFAISGTNIYDCSYVGAELYGVRNMVFTDCSITDCGTDGFGFNGLQIDESIDVSYNDQSLPNGRFTVD